MNRVLFAAATGMAAFLDASVGMFITLVIAKITAIEIPIWYLFVGSVLALLPDFDLVLKALSAWARGRKLTGDHRDTIMHIPLVMLPFCTLVAWVLGGWFWTVVTALCLLYHFIHDSRPFSIGGIDWLWTGRELPWMETPEWLERYWLRPTKKSMSELFVGVMLFGYVAHEYVGFVAAFVGMGIIIAGIITTWVLYMSTQ